MDLGSLVHCLFSAETDDTVRQQLKISASKLGPQAVIRKFVLAALREWIFLTNFPNFTPNNDRCLDTYRQVILVLGK